MLILEKAYAKFCQSRLGYQALDAGLVQDGLVAFTGGASQEIELGDAQPALLWAKLRAYSRVRARRRSDNSVDALRTLLARQPPE